MTSELRSAVEVATDCYEQEFFGIEAAAAVIEADRAATRADERAKAVGEIVAWLRERGDVGFLSASYAIEAGEWDKTGVQP